MGEPYVREIGHVEDGVAELPLRVGIDHGTVRVGCPGMTWQLAVPHADELVALLITAIAYAERRAAAEEGGCPMEAVFSDVSIPCTHPRNHPGPHSYLTLQGGESSG
jgi:hypothetical protein